MELWRLTATDLARLIRDGQVSAVEAARDALARLDAVNGRINAVVEHRPDAVLADAEAIDAARARGETPGPLAGVPVTTKVNADQRGFPTTNGLRLQRDLVAADDSPVVANLRRAGAVLLGRTNTPAFSLRWFTTNGLHGDTKNPRDPGLTPGGSSGGAGAAVAAGIGALAHGTDIAGSVRYPAYACGVHGLRPSLGRIPAWNASSPERGIGPQLMAVSGPLARSVADLRLGLAAMAAPDPRDPWWVPAPLEGPAVPRRAALCVRPDGLATAPEVEAALRDAARRLDAAGWSVTEIADTPPIREASELQLQLWLGDGYAAARAAADREGDPAAIDLLEAFRGRAEAMPPDAVARALVRRNTLCRMWALFLAEHPVLLVPVSGELPFPDGLDRTGEAGIARAFEANLLQVGLAPLGVPALTVTTGLVGRAPVGVQIVAARYREDLCLLAGEAVEAGGVPPMPVDPA
ncbi:amidase family protein [Methylobacterium sp. NEAU 140]|uniref:amidase family protein n=1 Tax=Methylobacterium sp. NEAU 140 TaxID=3064945 RepID=UPI002735E55C|nr:amidase family protein [Methylobacterium sp. NEAU 140]MDP4023329.1 amidase family protein [Methylobacterium sp. NEAU 140]